MIFSAFSWIKQWFDDGIKREPYPEPNSPSGFGWRPVNTEPTAVSSIYSFDGQSNFWLPQETKYWLAHSDLYPPARPPLIMSKRQKEDGTWEEYGVYTYSYPLTTNCYPISWANACVLNGGEPPETKQMASGNEMIVVTDFMRRNYRPRTDYNQTTLLF